MKKKQFNPYPGLRSFNTEESFLFFGRDKEINTLVKILRKKRFLAVIGSSGSGKSSLVRAGLIPALNGGLMPKSSNHYRYVIFRPGQNPYDNFKNELFKQNIYPDISSDQIHESVNNLIILNTLKRSSHGLIDLIKQTMIKERVIIIVDQFEELFRYNLNKEQNSAFVKLLLEASKNPELPIYVIITMRSDYIGDCVQFRDLPETINNSQFLVPKMTRSQISEAVLGPSLVAGHGFDESFVQYLLNNISENPDHLPILQHALMRTWDKWQKNKFKNQCIKHFKEIGGLELALSRHADEAYKSLDSDEGRIIACDLFKCLTEKGSDNREIRRPEKFKTICEILQKKPEKIIKVINVFRGCSFLTPLNVDIKDDTIIDISHESLMRIWQRLKKWVDEEAQSKLMYLRLAETSILYEKKKAGLWRNPDLQLALQWREEMNPNKIWAQRYHPGFDSAMNFLNNSEFEYKSELELKEKQRINKINQIKKIADERAKRLNAQSIAAKRLQKLLFVLASGFVITITMLIIILLLYNNARFNQELAINALNKVNLEKKKSRSRELAAFAMINLNIDSTLSFRLAQEALKQSPEILAQKSIFLPFQYPFHNVLTGHAKEVNYACFFNNGKKILSCSNDKSIRIWDTKTGTLDKVLKGHESDINIALITKNEKKIISASKDKTAIIWDVQTGNIIHVLNGHENEIRHIAISPDDELLATASYDYSAIIWDIEEGKLLYRLLGHKGHVNYVDFSNNGKYLATCSDDTDIRLFNVSDGNEIYCMKGHDATVISVNFSPDSQKIVSSSFDTKAIIWDCSTGYIRNILNGHSDFVNHAAFSPDGSKIVSSSYDKTIKIWDVYTGKIINTLKGHQASVWSCLFSKDSKKIISISFDKTARIWDIEKAKLIHILKGHESDINCANFSPDYNEIVTTSVDKTIRIWNIITGLCINVLDSHSDEINYADFSHDNKQIITASSDKTAIIWDTVSGKIIHVLRGHNKKIIKALFSKDGKYAATASYDKTIRIWDKSSGKLITILEGHTDVINDICFSPDSLEIVSCSNDCTVRIWDISNQKEKYILKGHKSSVYCVDFSINGKYIVSSSYDKTAIIWNVKKGKKSHILEGHLDTVNSAFFSFDSKAVLTGSDDTMAKIWDIKTGKLKFNLSGHKDTVNKAIFSDYLCATISGSQDYGAENTVRLWDFNNGKLIKVLKGHEASINDLSFSPNGKYLVTAAGQEDYGLDNTARLWDIKSGSEICIFKGHTDSIISVKYSPDGNYILTASKDKTARLWPGHYKFLIKLMNDKKIRGNLRALNEVEKQNYKHNM